MALPRREVRQRAVEFANVNVIELVAALIRDDDGAVIGREPRGDAHRLIGRLRQGFELTRRHIERVGVEDTGHVRLDQELRVVRRPRVITREAHGDGVVESRRRVGRRAQGNGDSSVSTGASEHAVSTTVAATTLANDTISLITGISCCFPVRGHTCVRCVRPAQRLHQQNAGFRPSTLRSIMATRSRWEAPCRRHSKRPLID